MKTIEKPQSDEYPDYMEMYIIDLPPSGGRILEHLQTNFERIKNMLTPLSEEETSTPHAVGEWTIKDVLMHIVDVERIMSYRGLRAGRDDTTALAGFEQTRYAIHADANARSLASILEEYQAVRMATITLFNYLPDDAFTRIVTASENPLSVRSAVYHIAGHEIHHIASIIENYQLKW